jgi:S-DNA-T family DNA segregation ATPase FtsK/SpoIIIE
LHRQAVATADAAAAALEMFTPSVSPAAYVAKQRILAAQLTKLATTVAPGWLGATLDGSTRPPTGTVTDAQVAVRIGTALPLPDAKFPVVVPLLGVGHLAIGGDMQESGLLRSILLRLIAATTPGTLRVRAIDPTGVVFGPFHALFDGRVMPPPVADIGGLRAVLSEAEQWVRTPAPPGRNMLVVVAGLPKQTDAADFARLTALAASGLAARLHLIVAAPVALPHATNITIHGGTAKVGDPPGVTFGADHMLNAPVHLDQDPPASLIEDICTQVAGLAKAAGTLRLTDLLPSQTWQEESAGGLSTTIGLTGHAPLALQLADLTPHWLIGGRTGAGKTAFLVNVLYGLCSRYSPDELTLYLLDFKEGVSFREFTPTDRDPAWIPHARAVGVESDRAYGLAVLRELDAEMARRSVLYKDAGVARFADLRETVSLPRIVCVIDEFQVLLAGDDRLGQRAVALLESVARKGRSYGIHLILASQTLRGIEALYAKRDSIFGQFAVRIALPGGADVLDVRNESAAALRLGTAVINTAGGFGGPRGASRAHERLVDFPDPHAEPKTLATLRRRLWLARPAGALPPYIFEGFAPAAFPGKVPDSKVPVAYVGRVIDVPLTLAGFPMGDTPGRHLAVIGPSEDGAVVVDAAVRSLALQHRPGEMRFVIAPLVATAEEVGTYLAESLRAAGHACDTVDLAGLRRVLADGNVTDTYVVGLGMDGAGGDLRGLLRDGPPRRTHLIGWWRGLRRFGEDTGGSAGRDDVAGVVLLGVSANDAALFLGDLELDWQPRRNRALAHDRHVSRTEVIVPFGESDVA